MIMRMIPVKIIISLLKQMTEQPMVLRRPNLEDIVSDRNPNIRGSSILEKFCGN